MAPSMMARASGSEISGGGWLGRAIAGPCADAVRPTANINKRLKMVIARGDRIFIRASLWTFATNARNAVPGQVATRSICSISLDHLVGASEQRRWHLDAERPRGLEVGGELGGKIERAWHADAHARLRFDFSTSASACCA